MIIDSPIVSGSSSASGSLNQHGNVVITGSLTVTGPISGALTGSVDSASFASTSVSSSYAASATSASFAVSATSSSYAINASFLNNSGSGEFVPTGSFNAFSSSILSYTSSNNTNIGNLNATSASLNTFTGSAASRLSSIESTTASLNTASGSAITRLNALEVTSGSNITRISALEVASGSAISRLNSIESTTGSLNAASGSAITRLNSIESRTGSYATTGSNTFNGTQTITGSLTITENLTVLGSSSISYISQSTLNIGTNLITVNAQNPSVRFGGLAVIDSGSVPQVSGSWLFDSIQNRWIMIHQQTSGGVVTSSIALMGPETYNNLGNETQITLNRLVKGVAGASGEHIGDSNISDTGTVVSINSATQITGSLATTSTATFSGNVGIGTTSPGYTLQVGRQTAGDNTDYAIAVSRHGTGASPGSWTSAAAITIQDQTDGGPTSVDTVGLFNISLGRFDFTDTNATNASLMSITYDGTLGPFRMDGRGNTWIGYDRASAPTSSGAFSLLVRNGISVGSSYQSTTPPSNGAIIQGSVGIGTTSPQHLLHLVSGSELTNPEASVGVYYGFYNSSSTLNTGVGITFGSNNNGGSTLTSQRIGANNEHALKIAVRNSAGSSTTRMTILGNGNVGIGTITPTSLLTVQGTQSELHVKNDATNTLTAGGWDGSRHYIKSINLGIALTPLTLQASSFTFDTGFVGIGTTSPAQKLSVYDGAVAYQSSAAGGAEIWRLAIGTTSQFVMNLGGTTGILYSTVSDTSKGQLAIRDGLSDLYPAYSFINDGDTGISNAGGTANTLNFITAATERMRITSGGNVGIGTTSPGTRLEIYNSSGDATFQLKNSNNTTLLLNTGGTSYNYIGSFTNTDLWLGVNNGVNLVIRNTSGNVGIGTTSPVSKLDVNGSIIIPDGSALRAGYSAGAALIGRSSLGVISIGSGEPGDYLVFNSGGNEKVRITSGGNVGIGTTSPGNTLQVNLASNNTTLFLDASYPLHLRNTSTTAGTYVGMYFANGTGVGATIQAIHTNASTLSEGALSFATRNSGGSLAERMYIASSGNVGIGTTSPGVRLDVNGSIYSSGNLGVANGNQSTNSTSAILYLGNRGYFTSADVGAATIRAISTGTFWYSGTALSFSTNPGPDATATTAVERMRITSDGLVGVGNWSTNVPQDRLHVNGALQVGFVDALNNALRIFWNGASSYGAIQTSSSSNLVLNPSGNNVGIGTTSVSSNTKLQVALANNESARFGSWEINTFSVNNAWLGENVYFDGSNFRYRNNGYTIQLYSDAGGGFQIRMGATGTAGNIVSYSTPFIVTPGGNVGIGTTSPSSRLHVVSSTTNTGINISHVANGGIIGFANTGSTGNLFYVTTGAGTVGSGIAMDNNGNLFIGKIANSFSVAGWELYANGTALANFSITNNEAFIFNNIATGTTYEVDFRTNSIERGKISVTDSGVSYITTSDYRSKEDLKPTTGLDKVSAIKIYDFKFKDTDVRMDGVLAHELQEIIPYAVTGEKDGRKLQGVDYSKLVPILIKSIQELTARVAELENK